MAKLLKDGRYVDNLLESTTTIEKAKSIAAEADEVLGRLNLHTKGYSFSGEPPEARETIDGVSIDVNAMKWFTEPDLVEVKIPPLHFGKVCRGRVVTEGYFESGGDITKMDAFVPLQLTRRMIVSKRASLYDALGKLEPIKAKLKIDERQAVQLTQDWDDPVPPNIRNKWLENFLLLEKLRGIRFHRARMPRTAVDTNMRLITLVDAAENLVMISTYCGFKLQDGGWSNQHLIGRSALATETIPRNELQALNGGSNLAWIVRKALHDWVHTSIVAGDSEIALKWTTYDSRKLGMWVRNRVIQIRRGTDFSDLYYVSTQNNVADVGTRSEKVSVQDVGPESRYETGDDWMRLEFTEAVEQGIIKPALDMKAIPDEKKDDFQKEFILNKEPEVLTRGHVVNDPDLCRNRLDKIAQRAAVSGYGRLLPTRRSFPSMVRIAGYVIAFINKCKDKCNIRRTEPLQWSGELLAEADLRFLAFPTVSPPVNSESGTTNISLECISGKNVDLGCRLYTLFSNGLSGDTLHVFSGTHNTMDGANSSPMPSDKYLNLALLYYFRQATREVLRFNSKQVVERRTILKDGVLLSRGRILDGMNFLETADLDTLNLGTLGIKTMIPVIDRFSPLAYSLGQYFHWKIAKHRGYETCLRMSLEHVHILQGMSLFKEISDECFRCKMKRGRYIQASQEPLSEKQLLIAPPFYACQIDLFGPLRSFVPGFEKETRAVKAKESKIWIFVAVCIVTGNVNLQVCEMRDTCSMLEAFIRLSCECGYPKYVCCDQESSLLPVMREIKVNLRDLAHRLYTENGVVFETCPVGGHEAHGKVERTIKSIQESLDDLGFSRMRLPVMGIQTLCKQIENCYNNLPLGYRYDRSQDNTKVLKMLVPNMLRIGRINSRALDGPVRLTGENRRMLGEIQNKYEMWYKIWCETYVPKLMAQKTGFKNSRDLKPDDIVYFQKKESELTSPWSVGTVDQVVRGRDGVIRKVVVKYRNSNEEFDRLTDRSSRKLIKLYSIDDPDLYADLSKLQARIDELTGGLSQDDVQDEVYGVHVNDSSGRDTAHGSREDGLCGQVDVREAAKVQVPVDVDVRNAGGAKLKCQCCCSYHCDVSFHNIYKSKTYFSEVEPLMLFQSEAVVSEDSEQLCDGEDLVSKKERDSLIDLIMSVGKNFG